MEKKRNKSVVEAKKYNANITKDDLKALGKEGLRMDTGDDRLLEKRKDAIDFAGKNLDIIGRNDTAPSANKKLKDEENSLYGQGGERNENLEHTER